MALLELGILLLKALPWTLALTIASLLVGALSAIPLCMMSISKNRVVSHLAFWVIVFFRSIPPLVWLFFIFFAVSQNIVQLSPFSSAVIGLGLITAANMAEIYRGALQAIPAGQREASTVLGLSQLQRARDIIGPQVFRYSLPATSTYAIGLLKDTAIASTIGVPEIAQTAYQLSQQTFQGLTIFAIAGGYYLVVSILMAWVSRAVDSRIRAKVER